MTAEAAETAKASPVSSSDFCDPFGFCEDWLHQFEMTLGVVVRF